MTQLSGRVAIVTGAGRGIGKGVAQRLAQEGAAVGVVSIDAAEVRRTVDEITATGARATGVVCDVTQHDRVPDVVAQIAAILGPVDILVNNAHDTRDIHRTVDQLTPASVAAQMDCGPIASLAFMQACRPGMAGRGGRIINVGSAAGVTGMKDYAGYAMAKEAIRALTRCAARSWATEDITVNCIAPSAATEAVEAAIAAGELAVDDLNPMQRPGSAYDDIGPAVVFLASKASRFVTGHTIFVDGGAFMDAGR